MNWQIAIGALLALGGLANILNDFGAFLFNTAIGAALLYWGVKKKGITPKAKSLNNSSVLPVPAHKVNIPDHYVVFDIETTGLSRQNDRIIEIAANEYLHGALVREFHSYVNPGIRIPNAITRLTGIRNTDVLNAPTIQEVKKDILSFFGNAVLVGHNINVFDIPFLQAQLNCAIANKRIDTLHLAKNVFPGLPSYKLSVLDQILELGGVQHHRASRDIIVNNALLFACATPQRYQHRTSDPSVLNNLVIEQRNLYPSIDIHSFTPTDPEAIPNTSLTGKNIVFSGELNMLREEAYQIAVDAGAILKGCVSKQVDYLVLGVVDPRFLDEDGMSSKERTALKLIRSGEGKVKIIHESEFLSLASPLK